MDTRTGNIYKVKDAKEQAEIEEWLGTKLIELADREANMLQNLPQEKRAEELALYRFVEERKRLRAKYGLEIQNAFRLGYKAGVKDNTKI